MPHLTKNPGYVDEDMKMLIALVFIDNSALEMITLCYMYVRCALCTGVIWSGGGLK